jgi:aminopeptidase
MLGDVTMDQRDRLLAKNIVNYSCALKKGDKILIECKGTDGIPLLNEIVKETYKVGAIPFTEIYDERTDREILLYATEEQINLMAEFHRARMGKMDAYVGLRCASNTDELADAPSEKTDMYARLYSQTVHHDIRVGNTRWVVLRYPNASMAQLAGTSRESFEEFYYNVCCLDYKKMSDAMGPLAELMDVTDKVRIKSGSTDISFSIKNIPSEKCAGLRNIPDGEIYTAPVKNSVNGVISYNTPSIYHGFTFTDVVLTFKDGKIIKAEANDTERINKILDTDEGARYVGEFAMGVNPYIQKPMKDILFDEKISGSFHFTPGSCYKDADNGNNSAVHWDLVQIQTPEYGGGEIYFDDTLIRKDGRFVLPKLEGLNPENLK